MRKIRRSNIIVEIGLRGPTDQPSKSSTKEQSRTQASHLPGLFSPKKPKDKETKASIHRRRIKEETRTSRLRTDSKEAQETETRSNAHLTNYPNRETQQERGQGEDEDGGRIYFYEDRPRSTNEDRRRR